MTAASSVFLVVAVALRNASGEVLVQQRPPGKELAGLWEFPGGKVEAGETPEEALAREVCEELGVTIAPRDLAPLAFASAPLRERHLLLLLYGCDNWSGQPRPIEATALRWATPAELRTLPMPPADAPFIDVLERLFRQ